MSAVYKELSENLAARHLGDPGASKTIQPLLLGSMRELPAQTSFFCPGNREMESFQIIQLLYHNSSP